MLIPLLLIVAGSALLTVGAEALVRGASALALRLGMAPLLIGLTVVAFGTSTPELLASLLAALNGSSDMAIGNVIGSNIANIALVLGLAAVIRPLSISRQIIRVDAPLAIAISIGLVVLMLDGLLSRVEGLMMATGIVVYVYWSVRKARVQIPQPAGMDPDVPADPLLDEIEARTLPLWMSIGMTLAGLAGLMLGANLFVDGAQQLALLFGVREAVIGLTVMAIGTSLPEIATVIAASYKGMSDLITGNAIGSNIFNLLCVLGVSASIIPLSIGSISTIDLTVFVVSSFIIWVMMRTDHLLSRTEGLLLVAGYLLYVAYLYS